MNRRSDFVLWSGLLLTGPWSAAILVVVVVGVLLESVAAAFDVAAAGRLTYTVAYYTGMGSAVVAPFTAVVGIPIIARPHHVGFWLGLLAVVVGLAWLALPFWLLFALLGSGLTVIAGAGLNFLVAVACAVILYRRRRFKRLDPQQVGDVFS
jgi:hypothetical protein